MKLTYIYIYDDDDDLKLVFENLAHKTDIHLCLFYSLPIYLVYVPVF